MIPGITVVRMTGGRDRAALPLLVLGPSLGTSAQTLWSASAAGLTDAFDVVAWDLPGHGHNRSVPDEPFTMAELAAGVLRVVDDVLTERGQPRGGILDAESRGGDRARARRARGYARGCEGDPGSRAAGSDQGRGRDHGHRGEHSRCRGRHHAPDAADLAATSDCYAHTRLAEHAAREPS